MLLLSGEFIVGELISVLDVPSTISGNHLLSLNIFWRIFGSGQATFICLLSDKCKGKEESRIKCGYANTILAGSLRDKHAFCWCLFAYSTFRSKIKHASIYIPGTYI